MRDKTIGCTCTNDDAIECMRDRDLNKYDDSESEVCSCCCHDVDEDDQMNDWEYNVYASKGSKVR